MNQKTIEAGGYYEVEFQGRKFVVEAMWPSLTFDDAWLVNRVDSGRTFVLATKYFVRPAHEQSPTARSARRYADSA